MTTISEINPKEKTDGSCLVSVSNEANTTTPFSDPIQRTKCLIQYIRLRKQRAEKELAKRNALKKLKKDAQAKLDEAKRGIIQSSEDLKGLARRQAELEQKRHDVITSLKAIHNRGEERKRKKEEEKQRLLEMEQKLQQAAALDAYVQLNNVKLLGALLSHRQQLNMNNGGLSIPVQSTSAVPVSMDSQKTFPYTTLDSARNSLLMQQQQQNQNKINVQAHQHQSKPQVIQQDLNSLSSALMSQQAQNIQQQLQAFQLPIETHHQQQPQINNHGLFSNAALNILSGLTPEMAQALLSNLNTAKF